MRERGDKIICVGKNYLDHARELGDAVPEKPVLFLKPWSAEAETSHAGGAVETRLPRGRGAIHHECEIVVKLSGTGARLSVAEASALIGEVTLGLDMTLRDIQVLLKKNGHPWEISKVFEGSAILGPWLSIQEFPGYLDEEFSLTVAGTLRQKARGRQMRLSPAECVAYASEYFTLCEGDVLFTGTPSGVGPVEPGQRGELRWGDRLAYFVDWR